MYKHLNANSATNTNGIIAKGKSLASAWLICSHRHTYRKCLHCVSTPGQLTPGHPNVACLVCLFNLGVNGWIHNVDGEADQGTHAVT